MDKKLYTNDSIDPFTFYARNTFPLTQGPNGFYMTSINATQLCRALDPRFESHQCLYMYKYVDQKALLPCWLSRGPQVSHQR